MLQELGDMALVDDPALLGPVATIDVSSVNAGWAVDCLDH